MEIMVPVWPEAAKPQLAKSDLASIRGATVALVDDNYDPVFTEQLERQLQETYGVVVKRFLKPWASAPSPKELIDEAAKCEVALVGVALCGSCTSGLVVDAATLEKRGIHTVTIVWDTFEKAARMAARIQGVPNLTLAVIPNRRGTDSDEDQRAKVGVVVADIVKLLQAT